MYRALWWKAWRELRTAALAGLAWMVVSAAYVLLSEWQHPLRGPIASLYGAVMLFQMFAAICLAVLVTQRERWEKSLHFTRALPVSLAQTAIARIGVATAALVVPVLIATVIVAVFLASGSIEQAGERAVHGNRGPQLLDGKWVVDRPDMSAAQAFEFLARAIAVALASGIQLLLVLSVLGNFFRSEKTVGFCGVVLSFVWLICAGWGVTAKTDPVWMGCLLPSTMIINYGYGTDDWSYGDLVLVRTVWPALALNLFVLAALAWIFARTYGRRVATIPAARRWNIGFVTRRLRGLVPHFRTPLGSLAWLTLRQALPLAVSGLIVALLIAAFDANAFAWRIDDAVRYLALHLGKTTWFVGMAWSVVVAAGVFGGELQPKLVRFWSSRPIAPGQWLVVKYITGLFAVLLVIDGTPAVAASIVRGISPDLGYSEMIWSYVAVMPLQHAVLYSLGVAAVIATRSGVFGAAAAMAAFTVLNVALDFLPRSIHRDEIDVYNDLIDAERAGQLSLWQHGYPLVVVWSIALIVICATIARRLLQRQLST